MCEKCENNPFVQNCGCGHSKQSSSCGGCSEPELCGCDKLVDMECVIYSGDDLEPIPVKNGMNGNLVVKTINDYVANQTNSNSDPTLIDNIGEEVEVYKGLGTDNKHYFRTLYGSELLEVAQDEDNVSFDIDRNRLEIWIKDLFNGQWFIDFLQSIFSTQLFQAWFATYITNLITSGQIDICTIISEECDMCAMIDGCVEPYDAPPTMTGDIIYNVPNRSINFPVNNTDFTSKYYDPEGDAFTSIKITGGNLTGLRKQDNSPLNINDIIPVGEINGIKYTSPSQDSSVTQTVTYVAVNSKGQQSN